MASSPQHNLDINKLVSDPIGDLNQQDAHLKPPATTAEQAKERSSLRRGRAKSDGAASVHAECSGSGAKNNNKAASAPCGLGKC